MMRRIKAIRRNPVRKSTRCADMISLTKSWYTNLCFPDEPASTRLIQRAFLLLIDLEPQRGEKLISRLMSRLLGQMNRLAMLLEGKGMPELVSTLWLPKECQTKF